MSYLRTDRYLYVTYARPKIYVFMHYAFQLTINVGTVSLRILVCINMNRMCRATPRSTLSREYWRTSSCTVIRGGCMFPDPRGMDCGANGKRGKLRMCVNANELR